MDGRFGFARGFADKPVSCGQHRPMTKWTLLLRVPGETSPMTSDDSRDGEIVGWLREQNYTAPQIERILAKVQQYDDRTLRESIFDSIDRGNFDIRAIIEEALKE